MNRWSRVLWLAGWPVRAGLVALVRAYRLTLGQLVGGNCRFYPSCSAYAEEAIRQSGAMRGTGLAMWRILRCSPLSRGGFDPPPHGRPALYEAAIHSESVH
jgi:putative membrane protein insertion efficiency factor